MLRTLTCPACQASLDLPETLAQPTIKCPYCNTTVIVPEDLRHSGQGLAATTDADKVLQDILQLLLNDEKIEAIKRYHEFFQVDLKTANEAVEALEIGWGQQMAAGVAMGPTGQKGRGCTAGAFVLVTLLVLAVGIAGALFFMVLPAERSVSEAISVISQEVAQNIPDSVVLNGPELLLPVGDGLAANVAFTSRDYNQEMMWVNVAGGLSWQSEALNDELGNQSLFADGRHIYYASEDKLLALDRADGRTVWQTTLSDRLPYTCNECLQSFGDRLVVQTLDNKLHILNAATGEEVKRLDLPSSSSGLIRVGDWTAVLADNPDSGVGLDLYDPAAGELEQRLEPRCPHPNFDPQEPSFTDPVLVDEADQSVYFIFGFFDPLCLQKWDYAANTQTWNVFFEEDLPPTDAAFTQDATHLYFNTGNHQVFAAAKSDGTITMLAQDDGYTLIPLATRNNVLLVKAIRTVGSSREELWGVDAANGGVLWKFVPQAEEEIATGSLEVVHASDGGFWTAQPTLNGVHLLQARQDPPRLVVETLGLRDGASSGQKEVPLSVTVASSYWFSLLGWDGDVAWVEVDLQEFLAVNPANGEIVSRLP